MEEKLFKKKFRIQSHRLSEWDYGRPGWYFVTICTNGRYPFFGNIKNEVMQLSEMGKIVARQINRIPEVRANIHLDEWVVMPDHLHFILVIGDKNQSPPVETPSEGVSLHQPNKDVRESRFINLRHWSSGTLGVIINQFKRSCTVEIRLVERYFTWQPRFYDHIIHDEDELFAIREYIHNNALKHSAVLLD
ncbi:MAG: transposase [Patescibacteria group bacterium]|jgi:REP element-mobilizing transposase RayT